MKTTNNFDAENVLSPFDAEFMQELMESDSDITSVGFKNSELTSSLEAA